MSLFHFVYAKTSVPAHALTVLAYQDPFPFLEIILPDGETTTAEASRRLSCATGGVTTLDPVGRSKLELSATSAPFNPNPLQSPSTPCVHFKNHAGPVMVPPNSQV